MKILMVLTSHDQLGNTGHKTGFWLEEFAAPYYTFKDAGASITLASPKGGQPPIDPVSDKPESQTASTKRFENDASAREQLATTAKLADINVSDFDAVFYPGGHGPLWDLATSDISINLIENFIKQDKPVAFVCHSSAVLRDVKIDGDYFVNNKKVTGFSNSEEEAVGLTNVVPFLLEDVLQERGAIYEKGPDWHPLVVDDGLLITGQNPASSEETAKHLIQKLQK